MNIEDFKDDMRHYGNRARRLSTSMNSRADKAHAFIKEEIESDVEDLYFEARRIMKFLEEVYEGKYFT